MAPPTTQPAAKVTPASIPPVPKVAPPSDDESELELSRLKSLKARENHWKKMALAAKSQRDLAVGQLQVGHEVVQLASDKIHQEMVRNNASAGVSAVNMVVSVVANAAVGNAFGAVSSVVIGGVNIALNRKRARDQQVTVDTLQDHLQQSQDVVHEMTTADDALIELEEEVEGQLTVYEWGLIKPDNVTTNKRNIIAALKKGESVAVIAERYRVDILFMTTYIDLYDLPIPENLRAQILKAAYDDYDLAIQNKLYSRDIETNSIRILGYAKLKNIEIIQGLKTGSLCVGREKEIGELLDAFSALSLDSGVFPTVWLRGEPGVGKSSVVEHVRNSVITERGLFATGKFNKGEQNIWYKPWQDALMPVIDAILSLPNKADKDAWKNALMDALGSSATALIAVLPSLGELLGDNVAAPPENLDVEAAKNQLIYAFLQFFKIITYGQKFVLCLEDLQWADPDSFRLIKALISEPALAGKILFIGSHRPKDPTDAASLQDLTALREQIATFAQVQQREIELKKLSKMDIEELVSKLLMTSVASARELADYVFKYATGNPFHTEQLLLELHKEGYISFSHEQGKWQWNMSALATWKIPENLSALIYKRVDDLGPFTSLALQWAACIGHEFNANLIAVAMSRGQNTITEDQIQFYLQEAVVMGLIEPIYTTNTDDAKIATGYYRFAHDQVRLTVLGRLTDEESRSIYYALGTALYQRTPTAQLDTVICDVVSYLNYSWLGGEWRTIIAEGKLNGAAIPVDNLQQLAELNAKAALQAIKQGNFVQAGLFAQAVITLQKGQQIDPQINRVLCQYYFLTKDVQKGLDLARRLYDSATSEVDKLELGYLLVYGNTLDNRFMDGAKIGLEVLNAHGFHIPSNPSLFTVTRKALPTVSGLRQLNLDQLSESTLTADPISVARMRLLYYLITVAGSINNENLAAVLMATNLSIWMEQKAFVSHPHILMHAALLFIRVAEYQGLPFDAFELAKKLYDAAVKIAKKCKDMEFIAWVHIGIGAYIAPWFQQPHEFMESFRTASSYGRTAGISLVFEQADGLALMNGDSAQTMTSRISEMEAFIKGCGNPLVKLVAELEVHFSKALASPEKGVLLNRDLPERDKYLSDGQESLVGSILHLYEGVLCYMFGKYSKANQIFQNLGNTKSLDSFPQYKPLVALYASSSAVASVSSTSPYLHPSLIGAVNKNMRLAKQWATYNFPVFGALYLTMLANKARVVGKQSIPKKILQSYLDVAGELPSSACCMTNSFDAATLYAMAIKVLPVDYPRPEFVFTIYLMAANYQMSKGITGQEIARSYITSALKIMDERGATALSNFIRSSGSPYYALLQPSGTRSRVQLSTIHPERKTSTDVTTGNDLGRTSAISLTPMGSSR